MEAYFFDYLRKSGFPEIVNYENENKIAEYIRNSVIDRVILRDIPFFFKTRNMALLENVLKFILSNPGGIINVNSLAKSLGENKITISNYLKFLESSLLIRSLSNFRPSFLSSSRKLKKFYPATPSLTFAYSKEIFEKNIGAILETYVVNYLNASYYFRKGRKEIDIILVRDREILPIEVKMRVEDSDLKEFSRLLKYLNASKGILVSLNQSSKINGIEIIPAYLLEKVFPQF